MTEERQIKHHRVVDYLDAHGLDAVLLSRRCNFSWYTCGAHNYVNAATDVGNSFLLVGRERAVVLTTNIEATRLGEEELRPSEIEIAAYPYHDSGRRDAVFAKAIGSQRVAADAAVPWTKLPPLEPDFDRLRWTLTDAEIARYRALCRDVVRCVESAARAAAPGLTEHALAAALSGRVRDAGAIPWVLLVAGDERVERHRHPLPTGMPVRRYFMLVVCAERGGLIAACTRLAAFGGISEELARKHRAVATVDTALISATRPGATLGEIYAEGQQAYRAVGFGDEWQNHHQGGSCGYNPRELIATPGEKTRALARQAFAWNPSIAGTKSEDTILCMEAAPERLGGPTDWPAIAAEWQGRKLERPDILAL